MTCSFYLPKWASRRQCHSSHIPPKLTPWLFDTSSLTARLIDHCGKKFHVKVLSVDIEQPMKDESRALGLPFGQHALVRQVILHCGDSPWVYARTIIPLKNRTGPLFPLTGLGSRPLGAVLFSKKTMRRSQIEIASIPSCAGVFEGHLRDLPGKVWGRRSVFTLRKRKLLVSEFFLPDIPADK